MKLSVINYGTFKLDGGAMFGVVPRKLWQSLNEPDTNNLCTWALRCLLVETGNHKILIDCGMGNKQEAKFFSHYEPANQIDLDAELNRLQLNRDDITDVFLTHLHFDHCGGAVEFDDNKNLVPTFKKATYWSNEKHWQWATNPNPREKASFLKENMLPLKESGQLSMVKVEQGIELFEGFCVDFAYGHTEAMMIPKIKYKDTTICYVADLIPSSAHVPLPYVMGYDVRPLLTMQEKEAVLKEAVDKNYTLFFEHDKNVECGKVEQTEKGIKLSNKLKLSEI